MNTIQPALQPTAPVRCLVIQLARLGDTVQSLMALRAAKQLYPHLEIHFLVRENFASAAQRIPWIEKVITFPTADILGPLIIGEKNQAEALSHLAQWITPLTKSPWDIVVNWSFSESSSFMNGLIPSKIKLGYTRKPDTSFVGADGWSHYVQGIVQGQIQQNIHLTDILTTQLLTALQIHVGDPIPAGDSAVTSKSFFSLSLTPHSIANLIRDRSRKWLSIQVGAGDEAKAWSPEKWAQFINLLTRHHPEYQFFLLGGLKDIPKANEILRSILQKDAVTSIVGEANFDLWTSVIGRSQWLFSADTAAIHLASVLGTRVFNLSIGPVRFRETGPYGNGHYVIASLDPNGSPSAEAVYASWAYATDEWTHRRQTSLESHFDRLNLGEHLRAIRVFRSKIRSTQDGGGVVYESILKEPLSLEDWTSMVVGQIARSWYCGWVPPAGHELKRETIGPQLIQQLQQLKSSTEVLSKICKKGRRTALDLHQKSATLKSNKIMTIDHREEFYHLGQSLNELEALIGRLAQTHFPLKTFSQMVKVLMHHLKGDRLTDLGKETADCYQQLDEGVTILRNWIQQTLELVKLRPIRTASIQTLESPQIDA